MTPNGPDKRANTGRGYLAGLGASGALVASAAVASLFLIALVAFDAWPSGNGEGAAQATAAAQVASAPGRAAATALAPAATAVAASPAPVQLAQAGNPNTVITPGDANGSPPGAGGSVGGSQGGGGGNLVTNPPVAGNPVTGLLTGVVGATEPLTTPLLQTVGGVGNGLEGVLNTGVPSLVGSLGLTGVLNGTLATVAGLGTGLENLLPGQTRPGPSPGTTTPMPAP
jgi:hypothetical protein